MLYTLLGEGPKKANEYMIKRYELELDDEVFYPEDYDFINTKFNYDWINRTLLLEGATIFRKLDKDEVKKKKKSKK